MLSHSSLSKHFWAEAASYSCYIINRSPHSSLDNKVPEEVWSKRQLDYSQIRIFGSPAYVHVREGKLDPRAKKCIFLGFTHGVKGFRLWCPEAKSKRIIHSRDVVFNEDSILSLKEHDTPMNSLTGNEKPHEIILKRKT